MGQVLSTSGELLIWSDRSSLCRLCHLLWGLGRRGELVDDVLSPSIAVQGEPSSGTGDQNHAAALQTQIVPKTIHDVLLLVLEPKDFISQLLLLLRGEPAAELIEEVPVEDARLVGGGSD